MTISLVFFDDDGPNLVDFDKIAMGTHLWGNRRNTAVSIAVNLCIVLSVISVFQLRGYQARTVDLGMVNEGSGRHGFTVSHTAQQKSSSIKDTLGTTSTYASTEILDENTSEDQEDAQENADLQALPSCVCISKH